MEKKVVAGRYRIERQIGEGGMGAVFEAYHVVSKKRVALKVLFPHVAKDDASRARFLREASAPAQIGHDGIVEVYDAGFDEDGSPFVAMEFLEGSTLADRMNAGRIALPEALSIFAQMLEPLAAAHAHHFVHRDLKPENVFLQRKPNGAEIVKILDFGIARELDATGQSVTQTSTGMGTPHYMAPEQAMSARGALASADVWSLGVMMYEVVTGTLPFDGETGSAIVVRAVSEPHRPTLQAAPGTPPALATLIDRCLSKQAQDRPQDARVLLTELLAIAQASGIPISASTSFVGAGGVGRPIGSPTGPVSHPGFVTPSGAHATQHPVPTPMPSGGFAPQSQVSGGFGVAQGYSTTPVSQTGFVPGAQPGFSPTQPSFANPASMPGVGQPGQAWPDASMPYPVPPSPPPAKSRKGMWIGILGGGLLTCVVCGGGLYYVGEQAESTIASVNGTTPVAPPQGTAPVAPAVPSGATAQRFSGSLQQGDTTLRSGEFADAFELAFQPGQRFRARLHAEKFDPYLIIRSPSGKSHDNDDVGQHDRDAQLDISVDEPGTWRIVATSFSVGESGEYELIVEPIQ